MPADVARQVSIPPLRRADSDLRGPAGVLMMSDLNKTCSRQSSRRFGAFARLGWAAFLAAAEGEPVAQRHLLHSTRREYQKLGKIVDGSLFGVRS